MFGTEAIRTAGRTAQTGKNVRTVSTDQEVVKDEVGTVGLAKEGEKRIVEAVVVVNDVSQKDRDSVGSNRVDEAKDYQAKEIVPCKDLREASNNVSDNEVDEEEVLEVQRTYMYQDIYDEVSNLVQKSKQKDLSSNHNY